ncbi:hypothetical protein JHK82_012763 [Glycine max]|uniref:Uncharacterized protein n=1 Tax=Glycine soja TaxID=3848 RepID=A0A0B2QSY0_GLYSO|nr:hypothetical protein JHK86_012779 [Glycine max]KAG5154794.1 hypothetical protein JHK82_012763 [Glycine max]KHN22943.1 hypothetical protein glysoja_037437 [Glycine soja]
MATPLNETREPEWKKAWTARNTLLSAPPLPILAIVGIVVFLLWVSSQLNNNVLLIHANSHNQRELVPLVFASVLTLIAQGTRLVLPAPSATRLHDEDVESSSMPWGWVVSVVMLLGNGRWKPGTVVVEMREGFSRDRTSSTTIGGYSQNQSQGIELDAQREEGCAATKVCGNGYGSHGRRPWALNESTKC